MLHPGTCLEEVWSVWLRCVIRSGIYIGLHSACHWVETQLCQPKKGYQIYRNFNVFLCFASFVARYCVCNCYWPREITYVAFWHNAETSEKFELHAIWKSSAVFHHWCWFMDGTNAANALRSPFTPSPTNKKEEKISITCESKGTNRYIDQQWVGYDLNTSKWESFPTPFTEKNDPYIAHIRGL